MAMQCLLDNLLMSADEHGQGMSREALRDELMTLLVAGQETSAILLAWTCAYLAHHPAVHAKAAEEVLQVLLSWLPFLPSSWCSVIPVWFVWQTTLQRWHHAAILRPGQAANLWRMQCRCWTEQSRRQAMCRTCATCKQLSWRC